tara:strand:+ start:380 stop:1510 length:1131 start_codon:yes stop_codon:yes gene_type:complete
VDRYKFLDEYMDILAPNMEYRGRNEGEREVVTKFLAPMHNAQSKEDFYLPTNKEEYIPMRNQAFQGIFGEGFADEYDKYKFVGQGGFGSVFEKPGDPSRVLKVQRLNQQRDIDRAGDEVEAQLRAAEAGVAPRVHTVETFPSSYRHRNSNKNAPIHIIEMDKVDNIMGVTGELKSEQPLAKLQKDPKANRKFELDFAKTRLALADKGVVHKDLHKGFGMRSDHLGYDPATGKTQVIDYGVTHLYDHAANLHKHNNNLNLQKEEYEGRSPTTKVKHFLDHKLDAIYDGMYAVGNKEEANIFKGLYKELAEKDLNQANDLINQGEEIIGKHSREDTELTRPYIEKPSSTAKYGYERNPTAEEVLAESKALRFLNSYKF